LGKVVESPKPYQKNATQAKRGGEKARLFFGQPTVFGQETDEFFQRLPPKNGQPSLTSLQKLAVWERAIRPDGTTPSP